MQNLQNRADELKLEQIRLKQAISEKNTASILVGLFQDNNNSSGTSSTDDTIDPRVDALLKRSIEDIPDASKIPELPALILSSKKDEDVTDASTNHSNAPNPTAGIDYKLLHKDRSTCSPSELDQIRRERNRMHAKRTRDRKRIFMEEMEVMICQLEEENCLLCNHLDKVSNSRGVGVDKGGFGNVGTSTAITGSSSSNGDSASSSSLMVSPEFGPVPPPSSAPSMEEYDYETNNNDDNAHYSSRQYNNATASTSSAAAMPPSEDPSRGDFLNQIESLLAAAGAFEKRSVGGEINAISCAESDVTASTENNSVHGSLCEEEEEEVEHVCKKARVDHCDVPSSITTTTLL
jgi:hypothetical protein